MRLDTALELCHQVRKRTADLRDHDLSSWLQLKKVLEYIPTTPSRIFALPAVIQGSVAIVEISVAAFCACCGAEITLKTEACPLCGAPQHGMLQPDLLPTFAVITEPSQDDVELVRNRES